MTFSHYAKVKNNQIVKTKFGKEVRVINVLLDGQERPIWINKLEQFSDIKPGQTISVVIGAKGSLTILEMQPSMSEVSNGNNSNIQMNRPSSQSEDSYYTYSNNGNNHNYPVNDDTLDLPVYGPQDKAQLKSYLDQQARIMAYIVKQVRSEIDEIYSEHMVKSLAITIFIESQKRI